MDFLLGLLPEGKDILWEKVDYAIKQVDSKPTAKMPLLRPADFLANG